MGPINGHSLDHQIEDALGFHGVVTQKLRLAARDRRMRSVRPAILTDYFGKFGHWLWSLQQDERIARSPHFRGVMTAYAGYRKAAVRAARLVEDGCPDRAEALLNAGCYHQASDILVSEMQAWRRNI